MLTISVLTRTIVEVAACAVQQELAVSEHDDAAIAAASAEPGACPCSSHWNS